MLTVQLAGGLGNQLFQIMTALATGWRQNIPVQFQRQGPPKGACTDRPPYWDTVFHRIPTVEALPLEEWKSIHEPGDASMMDMPMIVENSVLRGYFQSAQYFDDYYDRLSGLLTLPHDDQYQVQCKLKELRASAGLYVGVHIRRGDYLQLGWVHTNLTRQYYEQAIQSILQRHHGSSVTWVVFSDDLEWCRANVMDWFPKDPVDPTPNVIFMDDVDYRVLYIMKEMDAYILANSSFSWMVAYLGDPKKSKYVVCPKQWFQLTSIRWEKIYMPHWIQL